MQQESEAARHTLRDAKKKRQFLHEPPTPWGIGRIGEKKRELPKGVTPPGRVSRFEGLPLIRMPLAALKGKLERGEKKLKRADIPTRHLERLP